MFTMLIETTSGLRETQTDNIVTSNAKELVDFLKKNCTTAGFSIQFAFNPEKKAVVEVFKKGKPCQRDVKALLAAGFTEWSFSWAFAGKHFRLESGEIVKLAGKIDLVTDAEIEPWARAFGYR